MGAARRPIRLLLFRENCAWQLLTLLEVTDPNLRLSDKFILWTLPADTIRH
ncbi:MAG: DUF4105 domain-containing protein [Candidatus Competibacteraceae bacterium]|nr:DUF4105 domain-containing protein [Candidatus Competibacteraceae bacterium]